MDSRRRCGEDSNEIGVYWVQSKNLLQLKHGTGAVSALGGALSWGPSILSLEDRNSALGISRTPKSPDLVEMLVQIVLSP